MPRLDEFGVEILDTTPVSLPTGFRKPETLQEQVARLVRNQVSREAEEAGYESFDEADDFDVEDEFDPSTPFETVFDPVLGEVTPHDLRTFETQYRQKYQSLQMKAFEKQDEAAVLASKMKALIEGARNDTRFVSKEPQRRGEPRKEPEAE